MRLIPLLLLLIPALTASCTTATGPATDIEPSDSIPARDRSSTYFSFSRFTLRDGNPTSAKDAVDGRFRADPMQSSPAGTSSVWLNGTPVPRTEPLYSRYWMQGKSLPLVFDGSYHRVRIVGTGVAPMLFDSLRSPPTPALITAPASVDTLSLSRGFTFRWKQAGGSDSTLMGGYRISGSTGGVGGRLRNDTDSLNISSADLIDNGLVPGSAFLQIYWQTTRDTLSPQRHRYTFELATIDMIRIELVE